MKATTPEYWNTLRAKSVKKYREQRKAEAEKKPISIKKAERRQIRKVSIKQAKKLRIYEKNKAEYFSTKEHCEFPGCQVVNVQLHHMQGRIGDKLTNQSGFKALCFVHHEWVETHPNEAKELGLSENRL